MASYIVALTGASGVAYGLRLIKELLIRGDDVELVISPSGFLLLEEEAGLTCEPDSVGDSLTKHLKANARLKGRISYHEYNDLTAPVSSGSALKRDMIICPCSMGTLARVAGGISGNLIERAADCVIKEGGRLILVPRESPLSTIHLENMLRLARAGVKIVPAMPAFYTKPKSIDDMVAFIVGKVFDTLGMENDLYQRWRGG